MNNKSIEGKYQKKSLSYRTLEVPIKFHEILVSFGWSKFTSSVGNTDIVNAVLSCVPAGYGWVW